ncbi:MAG: DMT family transporter [Cyclobacteriaceae bacterium]|nr:DMT family transporter [Cyclobacteriaceae bacterium]
MRHELKDYLHLHFLVLIWGFTAIIGLLITIPPVEVVFYRTLISAAGLGFLLYYHQLSLKIGKAAIVRLLLTGSLIAAHWITFFASARVSTASVCLAGLATTSFWTSLLEPLLLRKKIKWYEVFLGLVVIGGLYIVFHFEVDHALGILLALVSAFLAALFTVINARFAREHHHHTITFYEMAGANLSILLFFPFYQYFIADLQQLQLGLSWSDFMYIVVLAIVCTVYAYSASIELMKRLSAFTVNLTVNLEPVYGTILAVLMFGEKEKMHPGFYMGAGVILFSVLAHPILNKYYKRKFLETDNLR